MKPDKEKRFLEIIQSHKGLILKICSLYAANRGDLSDLYQDIVLNLWKSIDTFRGESKYSTWIYRIALNTAIMNLRKRARSPLIQDSGVETLPVTAAEHSLNQEDFAHLYAAIRQLTEIERAIILLYLEEVPSDEISKITGLSAGNVRVRITRIKTQLKTILEKQGYSIN